MASALPGSHQSVDSADPGSWQEDAWERVDATLYNNLRPALESLQPFLAQIGLRPSRVLVYLRGRPDFRDFPARHHVKEMNELERRDDTYELAASVFVGHLLADYAPPESLRHFVTSLLEANNHKDNPNPGAWKVHDVLTLACVYMPVQQALTSLATSHEKGVDVIRTVSSHMSVQGFLTSQSLAKILELLELEGSPEPAIVLMLAFLYARQVDLISQEDEARWAEDDSGHISDDFSDSDQSELGEEQPSETTERQIPAGLTDRPSLTNEDGSAGPDISDSVPEHHVSEPAESRVPKTLNKHVADKSSNGAELVASQLPELNMANVSAERLPTFPSPESHFSSGLTYHHTQVGLPLPRSSEPHGLHKPQTRPLYDGWLVRSPFWVETLLELVEQYSGGHDIRDRIPEPVLSPETWRAVCDKLSFRQCLPEVWVSDDESSGESEASDVTIVHNGDIDDPNIQEQPLSLPRPRSMRRKKKNKRNRRRRRERKTDLNIQFGEDVTSNVVEIFHDKKLRTIISNTERQWDRRNVARTGASHRKDKDETSSTSTEENALAQEQLVIGAPDTTQDIMSIFNEITSDMITLRPYQEKLLNSAREGKNVMIVLPTGTGKTYVVLQYVQEFLSKTEHGRVMFMAPKIKLAEQQYHRFEHYFPTNTYFRCGRARSSTASFSELLFTHRVFILTPQCLVEAIEAGEVQITDFSLMILDECHHAVRRHPFKVLMDQYMGAKFTDESMCRSLPQIIGLTASPGVGEGGTLESALTHMKELCSNMDVEEICTVENEDQLKEYVNQPKHEIHTCKKRQKDGFRSIVETLMETIEDRMVNCSYVENHEDKELLRVYLKAPEYYRTRPRYTHWVGRLGSYLVKIANDRDAYTQFFHSAEMLNRYHQALILNEDCESQYALNYLKAKIRQMEEEGNLGPTDRQMLAEFSGQLSNLERAVLDASDYNPKLVMLEDILGQIVEKHEDDTSCMVFVRTLELSKAIQHWVQGRPDLMQLNPGRITGNSRPQCEGGMSLNAAAAVMTDFNLGKHKLVVCTSAAEEGLDFQACSAVIRYDYVTTMISMIQTRGRARRLDSRYFILGDESRGNAEREKMHMTAERTMNQAVEAYQNLIATNPNHFRIEMRQRQKQEWKQRLHEKEVKKNVEANRRAEVEGDVYNLYCRRCQRFACASSDIRHYARNTRIVISTDFKGRWQRVVGGHRQDKVFQNLKVVGKMHCINCSFDWGCVAKYLLTERDFPMIKLDSFILEDTRRNYKIPKKFAWKEAPFYVRPIEVDELANL